MSFSLPHNLYQEYIEGQKYAKVQSVQENFDACINASNSIATTTIAGIVRPDGETIKIDPDGTLWVSGRTAYSTTLASSGVWTAPKTGFYFVEVQGGGGAGGGLYCDAACGCLAGQGGCSGAYLTKVFKFTAGDIVNYTIGAGGVPVNYQATGSNGGSTTFSTVTSVGGYGGKGLENPSATGAYLASPTRAASVGCTQGLPGRYSSSTINASTRGEITGLQGGIGGGTIFGQGGTFSGTTLVNSTNDSFPGTDATGYGAGGGGGSGKNQTAYGGKGAPGCVRISFLGEF